jgi:cell division protein FtsN
MVNIRPAPGASQSKLFVLALGLLVGFVIAFVLLLSRLPTDGIVSQQEAGVGMPEIRFDYHAVLQEQQAARKPEQQVELADSPLVFSDSASKRAPEPASSSAAVDPKSLRSDGKVEPPVQVSAQRQAVQPLELREIPASRSGQDSYYVEAGNYRENNDALQAQDKLRRLGLDTFIVVRQDNSGGFGHRVRIGPFFEQSHLDATRETLRASGIKPRLIRVKGS